MFDYPLSQHLSKIENSISQTIEISITNVDDEKVAYLKLTLFKEDSNDVEGVRDVLNDELTMEQLGYLASLFESLEFSKEDFDFSYSETTHSGIWETLFIYPKFRNMGIATYLIENIDVLLLFVFNIHLKCLSIYPQPQNPDVWENIDEPEMLEYMKKFIVKNGFRNVTGNYYVKRFEYFEF